MQTNIKKKFIYFFSHSIKMSGKSIIFEDKKINNSSCFFYKNKNPLDNIDVDNVINF